MQASHKQVSSQCEATISLKWCRLSTVTKGNWGQNRITLTLPLAISDTVIRGWQLYLCTDNFVHSIAKIKGWKLYFLLSKVPGENRSAIRDICKHYVIIYSCTQGFFFTIESPFLTLFWAWEVPGEEKHIHGCPDLFDIITWMNQKNKNRQERNIIYPEICWQHSEDSKCNLYEQQQVALIELLQSASLVVKYNFRIRWKRERS